MQLTRSMINLGLSFSPAGLLTPFHLGVRWAFESDVLDLVLPSTPVAGASGGALTAVTCALDIDPLFTVNAQKTISMSFQKGGTLKEALDPVLDELLPLDSVEKLKNRGLSKDINGYGVGQSCTISYYELYPAGKARHVREFKDRADLLDCLRASCAVPFYFDGFSPIYVRDSWAWDGIFAVPDRWGCPDTGAEFEILSCPFPADTVGLKAIPGKTAVVSPHLLKNIFKGPGGGWESGGASASSAATFLKSAESAGIDTQLAAAACLMGPFSRVLLSLRPPASSVVRYFRDFCESHEAEFNELTSDNNIDYGGSGDDIKMTRKRKHWREYDDHELAYMALFHQGALSAYLLAAQSGYDGLPKM